MASGTSYSVTVSSQPTGQICTVSDGSGTVSATVSNVSVKIPKYLREHPDTSLSTQLREILASRTHPVTEADLVSILSVRRDFIDSWAAYVEDQRTSDGWYVAISNDPTRRPEWILAQPGRKNLAFDSPIAAYAALILRIVAQGLGFSVAAKAITSKPES